MDLYVEMQTSPFSLLISSIFVFWTVSFYERSARSQNEKMKVYFCEISSEISQKAIK